MFSKDLFYAVLRSVLNMISNVRMDNKQEIAWDATTRAWELLFRVNGVQPSFYYWRLVAYHQSINIIRHRAARFEFKRKRVVRSSHINVEDYNQADEDGVNYERGFEENLRGMNVADPTPLPSAEWTWLRDPGAVRSVLLDVCARFKRSEWRSFTEVLNDVEFPTTTEEGRRENDRHCQGMTRFRKRAVELLKEGNLPRRTHQFLAEFLSRDKCNKRVGCGRKKK